MEGSLKFFLMTLFCELGKLCFLVSMKLLTDTSKHVTGHAPVTFAVSKEVFVKFSLPLDSMCFSSSFSLFSCQLPSFPLHVCSWDYPDCQIVACPLGSPAPGRQQHTACLQWTPVRAVKEGGMSFGGWHIRFWEFKRMWGWSNFKINPTHMLSHVFANP